MCIRDSLTGPEKTATVTTEPSVVRVLVTTTRGGTGRGRGAGDVVARAVAVVPADRDGPG